MCWVLLTEATIVEFGASVNRWRGFASHVGSRILGAAMGGRLPPDYRCQSAGEDRQVADGEFRAG